MSDAVIVALIAGTPGLIASILGFLNQVMIRRTEEHTRHAEQHTHETKEAVRETKEAIVILEKNTNSIKDQLVQTTAVANRALGNLEGRKELRAEHAESEEHSG